LGPSLNASQYLSVAPCWSHSACEVWWQLTVTMLGSLTLKNRACQGGKANAGSSPMADKVCRPAWPPDAAQHGLRPRNQQRHGGRHHILVHGNGRTGTVPSRSKGDDLRHLKTSPPPHMGSCCGSGRWCATAWASRAWALVGSSGDWCGRRPARRPPRPGRLSGARCATCAPSMPAPSAEVATVHAKDTRSRQLGECRGHRRHGRFQVPQARAPRLVARPSSGIIGKYAVTGIPYGSLVW
jgi:hypothetical protein